MLGGEPHEHLTGRRWAARPAITSGVRTSVRLRCSSPACFFILPAATSSGRKSATAAAEMKRSAVANADSDACWSSAADSDLDPRDLRGCRDRDVRGQERDARAARRGRLGEGHAHPARAAVADEAHGVDRLARAAGRDDDVPPARPSSSSSAAARSAVFAAPWRVRSTSARRSAGSARRPCPASPLEASRPSPGSAITTPTLAQQRDVRLRGRVAPHPVVHRRGDDQRLGHERGGGEEIVGEAVREACDRVRRGGSDQHQVGAFGEGEVTDRAVRAATLGGVARVGAVHGSSSKDAREHRRARQRRKAGWADESGAALGEDDPQGVPRRGGEPNETRAPCRQRCCRRRQAGCEPCDGSAGVDYR